MEQIVVYQYYIRFDNFSVLKPIEFQQNSLGNINPDQVVLIPMQTLI